MISAFSWVRRGAASVTPIPFEISEEVVREYLKESDGFLSQYKKELMLAKNASSISDQTVVSSMELQNSMDAEEDDEDVIKKYQLDEYEDKAKEGESGNPLDSIIESDDSDTSDDAATFDRIFSNLTELTMNDDMHRDPYLVDKEHLEGEDEKDDLTIRPLDYLLVATRAPEEDDISQLEFYVYEEEEDNLYVHHDIMLPTYPLCLEWMQSSFSSKFASEEGNFVAVGTFDPEIEIWNLDLLDPIYPELILGKSKKDKKVSSTNSTRHAGAVMSLSWNKSCTNLLASGSADTTIKLWDLHSSKQALRSYQVHTDKVQSLQWNPFEPTVLASAGYDKTMNVFDTRSPHEGLRMLLSNDAEFLRWNPHAPYHLAVSDESGLVYYVDTRTLSSTSSYDSGTSSSSSKKASKSKALFTIQAHSKATTSIDFNPFIPHMMLTSSLDHCLKLWDLEASQMPATSSSPSIQCLFSHDFGQGKIFSASFSQDSPFLVAYAGKKGDLNIWRLHSLLGSYNDATKNALIKVQKWMEAKLSN